MAGFTKEYTVVRPVPDYASLLVALKAIDPAIGLMTPAGTLGLYSIFKDTAFTPQNDTDITAAINAAPNSTPQLTAQTQVDIITIFDKALFLTAVDETNRLRQWITDFKAAVAAATTLADLKTRVANLNDMPQVPVNTAIQAMRNKAGTL